MTTESSTGDEDKGVVFRVLEAVLRPLATWLIKDPKSFFFWLAALLVPLLVVTFYYTMKLLQEREYEDKLANAEQLKERELADAAAKVCVWGL